MPASQITVPRRSAARSRTPVVTLRPPLRKLVLTAHVTASVGWLGAVLVFLALALTGLTSDDASTVRAVYLLMRPLASAVLVPLAVAALATGILSSLGTAWGLFRHYWVLVKLGITAVATAVLFVHLPAFDALAEVAGDPAASLAQVRDPAPAVHASLALIALLVATVLSTYKPKGLTPLGVRERILHSRVGHRDAPRARVTGGRARLPGTAVPPPATPPPVPSRELQPAPLTTDTWTWT